MSAERIFAAHPAPEDGGPDFRDMSTESTPSEIQRPTNVVFMADVKSAEDARAQRPANVSVRASADGERHLVYVLDGIGGWGVWASELIPQLRQINESGKPVDFLYNSPGGDIFEAITIGNFVRSMTVPTRSIIIGMAASAASVMAIASDEVLIAENGMMMIHRPWMLTAGEASDLRDAADLLDKIEVQIVNEYARKAKDAKREDLAQAVAEETWYTAEEAVAVGHADMITSDYKIAASAVREIKARGEVPDEAVELLGASDEEPAAVIEASVADPVAEIEQEGAPTEITSADEAHIEAETTPEAAPAEPEQPTQPEGLSIEAQAEIRTACKLFDAADRADEFISARATLDDVRAALWNARAEQSAQTEINTRVTPSAEDPKPAASNGWTPGTPTTLQRANAARAGRKL